MECDLHPLRIPRVRGRSGAATACHIACAGCGHEADVTLEALLPSGLRLRCLGCRSDVVLVLGAKAGGRDCARH